MLKKLGGPLTAEKSICTKIVGKTFNLASAPQSRKIAGVGLDVEDVGTR